MISCSFENGNNSALRHVVADALTVNGRKILLVKRAKHLIQGGKWAIPGGYVDRDESLEMAAVRELKEETGLDGQIVRLFKMIDDYKTSGKDDRQNVKFIYEVKADGKVNGSSEGEEVKWFDVGKIPKESEFAFDHFKIVKEFIKYKFG